MLRMAFAVALALLLAPPAHAQQLSGAPETRVLFLGNSYTHNVPQLFADLAAAGGHAVAVAQHNPGGITLGSTLGQTPHMSHPTSLGLIAQGGWDVVVLQEQSVTPMIELAQVSYMEPGALSLHGAIQAGSPGATTMLFQTWARRDPGSYCWASWCSPYFETVEAMQDQISLAYQQTADPLPGAQVAPVGEAWRLFRQENDNLPLHASDGSHANGRGQYLSACVFYAQVFGESPLGLDEPGPLTVLGAELCQDVALRTVFDCGWTTVGGEAGGANTMTLVGEGTPSLGGSADVLLQDLPPGAAGATLILSLGAWDLPAKGGTLLVDLDLAFAHLVLPAVAGSASVSLPLPHDAVLLGLPVHLQAATPDPGAPAGWAFSNALRLATCP